MRTKFGEINCHRELLHALWYRCLEYKRASYQVNRNLFKTRQFTLTMDRSGVCYRSGNGRAEKLKDQPEVAAKVFRNTKPQDREARLCLQGLM